MVLDVRDVFKIFEAGEYKPSPFVAPACESERANLLPCSVAQAVEEHLATHNRRS